MTSAPLLSVENLSVSFHQNGVETKAVRGVSFHIHKGDTLALVGESGSGKSVTALSVLKLLPYPAASHPSGKIIYDGKDLLQANDKELRRVRGRAITMVFQEPMSSLNPLHTIQQQVGEILKIHKGWGKAKIRTRVLELLEQVGIRNAQTRLNAYPHQLSGGQRQRVMIAMALANEPDLLIADEPTTALDVTVQAQILTLLKDLQKQHGMALLFITHDLGIVRKIADRVCVMTEGEIVESGPVESVFTIPQHIYTKKLLGAEPKAPPPAHDTSRPIMLEARDIKVWFPIRQGFLRRTIGHVKAVDGVSLTLHEGQTLGIVGESGSGKTTLGLALLRLVRSEGLIVYQGQNINGSAARRMRPLRQHLQVVFQDPYGSLSPRMSVSQIVEEGLCVHYPDLNAQARRAKVMEALRDVGLDLATIDRYPHEFSGGQRQRIAIARAIVLKPQIIVLDEPTSALDMSVQAQIVDLLRHIQAQRNLSYLFISHDLKVVRALASQVLVMREGKVIEQGLVADIFETPREDYTKSLIAAAVNVETRPQGEGSL
jgi:microcin C transport system ATP-binding protein